MQISWKQPDTTKIYRTFLKPEILDFDDFGRPPEGQLAGERQVDCQLAVLGVELQVAPPRACSC
eukprot:2790328-Pyramimonas_sp.AAC.1